MRLRAASIAYTATTSTSTYCIYQQGKDAIAATVIEGNWDKFSVASKRIVYLKAAYKMSLCILIVTDSFIYDH